MLAITVAVGTTVSLMGQVARIVHAILATHHQEQHAYRSITVDQATADVAKIALIPHPAPIHVHAMQVIRHLVMCVLQSIMIFVIIIMVGVVKIVSIMDPKLLIALVTLATHHLGSRAPQLITVPPTMAGAVTFALMTGPVTLTVHAI